MSNKPSDRSNTSTRDILASSIARWPAVIGASLLVYLVCAVFFPILHFEFVDYDVPDQMFASPYGQGLSFENVKYIFTSRCVTSYYPLRSLSYAVDYDLWGLYPGGFKLTNGLIHLANVLLVFWLMLRLFRHPFAGGVSPWLRRDVCVATFSAGIYAVHPVVVEPVVWVAGREELLMTLGTLGCVHFHLTARRLAEEGGKPRRSAACYGAAAICCAAACLSNAVGAVIPLLIVAWDVLTLPRPKLSRIVRGTSVLWAVGVATIVVKRLGADSSLSALAKETGVFSMQRLSLVLNVYWLNLKTLLWPRVLAIEYPSIDPGGVADARVILGGIAVGLTCAILWVFRREKLILFGLLWYGLALGPTAQIMPHHIDRSDRFLYLPLIGLVLALAMGLRPLVDRFKGRELAMAAVAGVLSLLLLDTLSATQVQTWRTSLLMWGNCLRVDPNNGKAHGGLADNLAIAGRFERALQHYRQSLLLDQNNLHSLKKAALLLATCPVERFRNYDGAVALAERAHELAEPLDPSPAMVLAEVYAQAGRAEMAVTTTEEAIRVAEAAGKSELAGELRSRLELYQDGTGALHPP